MKPRNRKLVVESNEPHRTHEPNLTDTQVPPFLDPTNATVRKPINPNNGPFDSSMALTVLALLVALFFVGLFSIYIRRFEPAAEDSPTSLSRRRRLQNSNSPIYVVPPRRAAPKGVDPSTVRSLPVYYYHGDAKHRPNDCAVCLSEFEEREEVKMIPYCRHVFHPHCIERWLSPHVLCPLCRTTRLIPVDADSKLEGRFTVEIGDTCALSVRRTSSGSSLGERVSPQRTLGF